MPFEHRVYTPADFELDPDWRLLDRDLDLFGEGLLKIISAPGHSPGHQSLVVNFAARPPLVLLGDAAYNLGQMRHGRSPDAMVQSWERLKAIEHDAGAELRGTLEADAPDVPITPSAWWGQGR